jgi:exopolyphosphatase / guanosine-5'-triphosphate,3'-diphosphate pyrophosphatase
MRCACSAGLPGARRKKGTTVRDADADASASGSGPSESGTGPSDAIRTGATPGVTGHSAEGGSGHAAKLPQGGHAGDNAADATQDGRLDHHKDKKGRKRRRRRRGAQNPARSDNAVRVAEAEKTPIPDAGVQQPRRKHRRRRKKPHATVAGNAAAGTVSAQPSAPVAREKPGERPINGVHDTHRATAPREQEFYAALDLGTNNCRLLVALPTRPGQFRVVDAFSRIVRLGEGLSRTGRMSEPAMDRAVEALKICRDKLETRPLKRMRLIATEACRSAENGAEFLQRVHAETGLELEIVDRETEARLAVSGCSSLVGRDTDSVVLFDIGGGSSEIALVDVKDRRSRRLSDHIVAWTSLKVGVVTLSEKFDGRNVTEQSFADMIDYATDLLSAFEERDRLADRVGNDGFHLLGTSGTVTTLAGIHLDLPRYDRRRVDGLWMTSDEVDTMNARLLSWSFDERVANPCIGADRADLVMAGCAILEAIRRVWPSNRLRVADRGLREGILTEMMAADGVWRRSTNPWRNRPHWSNR